MFIIICWSHLECDLELEPLFPRRDRVDLRQQSHTVGTARDSRRRRVVSHVQSRQEIQGRHGLGGIDAAAARRRRRGQRESK